MAISHGMDIAQVRSLASAMRTSAGDIEGIISKLTGMLDGTEWLGTDRSKFENDWKGQYTQQLRQVIQGLNDAARMADDEARQQEDASNT